MPFFQFGLENEAQIYYLSALNALRADPEAPRVTRNMAANMRDINLQDKPLSEVASFIVKWTRESIRSQGSNDEDENGVAWMLALYVKSYEIACEPKGISFKEVYTTCFKKYYGG